MIALTCFLLAATLAPPVCPAPRAAQHPTRELHQVVPAVRHTQAWRT